MVGSVGLNMDGNAPYWRLEGGTAILGLTTDRHRSMVECCHMLYAEVPVFRNRLSACRSPDLRSWSVVNTLLVDDVETDPAESVRLTGVQYVDWQFDGEDIIYLVCAAYDGARGWHDANRIVFGRLEGFRALAATA